MKHGQNIKDSVIVLKLKSLILPALRSLGVGGILAFCVLNLVFSQLISPIYFQFVDNDRKGTIVFLQKIKVLPEYQNILKINNNIYGNSVGNEILAQENRKKETINKLEQQLLINPKARDVLYSLYQLYLTEGDKNRANDYLRRAKDVDPNIN